MAKTYKVQPDWFKKKDSLKHIISSWGKKVSEVEVECFICNANINCEKKGYAALTQHVKTKIHDKNASLKLANNQLVLVPRDSGTFRCTPTLRNEPSTTDVISNKGQASSAQISLFHRQEATAKAEIIWALKTVAANISPAACEDIKDVFQAMFPDAVPQNFSLGRTKLSYLITEALGPYFLEKLLEDIKDKPYTLLYDETTNHSNQKELQIAVRYWSQLDNEVVNHHLKTVFLGHATAADISNQIRKILNEAGLSTKNLLMLGSDGPKVNKKVLNLIDKDVIEERGKGLLDIGTCNLHVVHNTFLKGLAEYGEEAKELIVDVYNFFKKFPSRWEDYISIQEKTNCPSHRFLKHTSTRWLTIVPAAERILEQWPAVIEYFQKFIPTKHAALMKTEKFKRIANYLKCKDIKVELEFIVESSEIFVPFLKVFQMSMPLVHILHSELTIVLQKISGRIYKKVVKANGEVSDTLLPISDVYCGSKIKVLLAELKQSEATNCKHKMQQHYLAALSYLTKKMASTGKLLQYMKCLQPNEVTKPRSVKYVCHLASSVSFLQISEGQVRDEWLLLQSDFSPKIEANGRIDHQWRTIFEEKTASGVLKYPNLSVLVKACLTLSHGNSDVERGFSVSQRILSEDKASMSEKMLNARMIVRDGIKKYESVSKIPITKPLLKLSTNAAKSYLLYLDSEKQKKEQKAKEDKEEAEERAKLDARKKDLLEKKSNISSMETKIKYLLQEKKTIQSSADALIKEGNERLKRAVKKSDVIEIQVAQSLLEAAERQREKERNQEKKTVELDRIVNKRKATLIDVLLKDTKKCKKI